MSLSSSSTLAQVQAAFDDNALYDVNGSTSQCRDFIHAGRILLRRIPTESRRGASSLRYELKYIETQLARAVEWLAANDSDEQAAGAIHFDLQNFRD